MRDDDRVFLSERVHDNNLHNKSEPKNSNAFLLGICYLLTKF